MLILSFCLFFVTIFMQIGLNQVHTLEKFYIHFCGDNTEPQDLADQKTEKGKQH